MQSFGITSDVIVADAYQGGFQIIPTEYTASYRNNFFPEISIHGFVGKSFTAKVSPTERLRAFSLIELMDEVGRRIKTGENKKEGKRV